MNILSATILTIVWGFFICLIIAAIDPILVPFVLIAWVGVLAVVITISILKDII